MYSPDGGGDPDPGRGMAKIRNRRILNKSILTQLIKRILVRLTPGFRHAATRAQKPVMPANHRYIALSRSLSVSMLLCGCWFTAQHKQKNTHVSRSVSDASGKHGGSGVAAQRHKAKQCSHIRLSLFRFEQHNTHGRRVLESVRLRLYCLRRVWRERALSAYN